MTPLLDRAAAFIAAFATAALVGAVVGATFASAAADNTDIGTATAITTNVTASGAAAAPAIVLKSGDAVFQNQIITPTKTASDSSRSVTKPSSPLGRARLSSSIISYMNQRLPRRRWSSI